MNIIESFVSDDVLNSAYEWLCQSRKNFPDNSDIWSLRQNWPGEKARLRAELLSGAYRFGLLSRVTLKTGEEIDLWPARDAVVLKGLSLVLAKELSISPRCAHLKGNGGSKGAVREVLRHLEENRFVLRTDIKLYYASIDHDLLLDRLARFIDDSRVLNLLTQYLKRSAERGGQFWHYQTGISLGCPLSPVIGAFFLRDVDVALERLGLFFVRYMDDVLVLAPTRSKLRRAVKKLNCALAALKLEKHPQKTFIGRIDKGFDFLGYHFAPGELSIARSTVAAFIERAHQLYEQEPRDGSRLGAYARRWAGWAGGGLCG